MSVRDPLLLHGNRTSLSATDPHRSDDRHILLQDERTPLRQSFNWDFALTSDKTAIAAATTELKQRIVENADLIQSVMEKRKVSCTSSLLTRLFLRRVVELFIVEGCYAKVGTRRS